MSEPIPSSEASARQRWKRWIRPGLAGAAVVFLNILAYILIPVDVLQRAGAFGYVGAFITAAIANASVVVPVPYYPVIARLAQALDVWGVVLAAAAGSALGESVAFFVGRMGRAAAEETRFYRWVRRQLQQPWRAALALFILSAPPNPAFDVAGLLAGALGVPLWMFLSAVFLGRMIRMALVALVGVGLAEV